MYARAERDASDRRVPSRPGTPTAVRWHPTSPSARPSRIFSTNSSGIGSGLSLADAGALFTRSSSRSYSEVAGSEMLIVAPWLLAVYASNPGGMIAVNAHGRRSGGSSGAAACGGASLPRGRGRRSGWRRRARCSFCARMWGSFPKRRTACCKGSARRPSSAGTEGSSSPRRARNSKRRCVGAKMRRAPRCGACSMPSIVPLRRRARCACAIACSRSNPRHA